MCTSQQQYKQYRQCRTSGSMSGQAAPAAWGVQAVCWAAQADGMSVLHTAVGCPAVSIKAAFADAWQSDCTALSQLLLVLSRIFGATLQAAVVCCKLPALQCWCCSLLVLVLCSCIVPGCKVQQHVMEQCALADSSMSCHCHHILGHGSTGPVLLKTSVVGATPSRSLPCF